MPLNTRMTGIGEKESDERKKFLEKGRRGCNSWKRALHVFSLLLRAYIESVESPTSVNIFFVDFGTREVVVNKDLRLLRRRYLRLPFQVSLA